MALPATWHVHTLSRQGNEYYLYDQCDLESTLRHTYLGWWLDAPIDFATWKDRFPHHIEIAENKVSDACRYRDASRPSVGTDVTVGAATVMTVCCAVNRYLSLLLAFHQLDERFENATNEIEAL